MTSLLRKVAHVIGVAAQPQESRTVASLAFVRHRVGITHLDELDRADLFAGRVDNPVAVHDLADGAALDGVRIHFTFGRIIGRHREWIALAHRWASSLSPAARPCGAGLDGSFAFPVIALWGSNRPGNSLGILSDFAATQSTDRNDPDASSAWPRSG